LNGDDPSQGHHIAAASFSALWQFQMLPNLVRSQVIATETPPVSGFFR
jgi:hypothetical protein